VVGKRETESIFESVYVVVFFGSMKFDFFSFIFAHKDCNPSDACLPSDYCAFSTREMGDEGVGEKRREREKMHAMNLMFSPGKRRGHVRVRGTTAEKVAAAKNKKSQVTQSVRQRQERMTIILLEKKIFMLHHTIISLFLSSSSM
jgi:hypothetical protein